MIRFTAIVVCIFCTSYLYSQSSNGQNRYTFNFETQLVNPPWVVEGGKNAATVIQDPTQEAQNKVLEVRLPLPPKKGMVWSNATARSEIRWQAGSNGIPAWFPNGSSYSFQFRIYIPEDHICDPVSPELISQWHSPRGFKIKTPPIMIRIADCQVILLNNSSETFNGDPETVTSTTHNSGLKWIKSKWHYFIIDVSFDFKKDTETGGIKVYMNPDKWPSHHHKIIDYQGPVGYNNGIGQNFKLGVYKWRWKFKLEVAISRNRDVPIAERLYYYDDVTIKSGLEFAR